MTEAWLRGPIQGVDPYLMPAAHAFLHAREDLARCVPGLTPEMLWATPGGAASVGFHLRHLAGATDRLLTYARGQSLSEEQRKALQAEKEPAPGSAAEALLAGVEQAIDAALEQLRATPQAALLEPRAVGRAGAPSNVLGLIVHAAEHAQRHAGQVLATAKVVRGGAR